MRSTPLAGRGEYSVLLETSAKRDLDRLSRSVYDRIIPHVISLRTNPRLSAKKLAGSKQNDWRMRVGDYRILYEINDPQRTVRVMRVLHRREAYRFL